MYWCSYRDNKDIGVLLRAYTNAVLSYYVKKLFNAAKSRGLPRMDDTSYIATTRNAAADSVLQPGMDKLPHRHPSANRLINLKIGTSV